MIELEVLEGMNIDDLCYKAWRLCRHSKEAVTFIHSGVRVTFQPDDNIDPIRLIPAESAEYPKEADYTFKLMKRNKAGQWEPALKD